MITPCRRDRPSLNADRSPAMTCLVRVACAIRALSRSMRLNAERRAIRAAQFSTVFTCENFAVS